jgi:UDP-glucose 4-epimerase
MRALVTGGAGFIGRHVVRTLLGRGLEVTVLDDLSVGSADALPRGVRLVRGDVRDPAAVADALMGADYLFHLAAVVSVRASMEGFVRDADVNVLGTLRVLEGLRGREVRKAVLASSMAVYAEPEGGAPLSEDARTEPVSPYGVAKLAAERYWQLLCPVAGVEGTVLRYFNTYGPGQTPSPYVGVITHFLDRIRRGRPPLVYGDGGQRRDFVHVEDVAAATAAVLDHPVGGQTFNVGTGSGTSVATIARGLLDQLAPDLEPRHTDAVPGELHNAVADISAARGALGYRPSRPVLDFEALVSELGPITR